MLPPGRSPDVCLAGARFPIEFSSCTQAICGTWPSCCKASWSSFCVMEAQSDDRCAMPCGGRLAFAGKGVVPIVIEDPNASSSWIVETAGGVSSESYSAVAWADLDGVGPPELVVGTSDLSTSGHAQEIDHYDGSALTLAFDVTKVLDPAGGDPFARRSDLAVSVGDYDGDGWADVAWMGVYPMFLTTHNREALQFDFGPTGTMGPPDLITPIAGGIGWADVDGDGKDDLALDSDAGAWVLHSAGSTLVSPQAITLPDRPYWGAWGDLDGDGVLDLAIAGNNFARVFQGTGTGLATTAAWSLDGIQFYAGAWIDFDHDGDLDLALTINDGKLNVYENLGGTLRTTESWQSLEDNEAPGVIAADVNRDGYMDLVIANHLPDPPRIYINRGDRTFELATVTMPAVSYESVSSTSRTAPTR